MIFNKLYFLAATSVFVSGCAGSPEKAIVELRAPSVNMARVDRGIEVTQRALPTKIDAARQPAHYQHVYVDSLSDVAESLKTIPLADAVANDVLASSDLKVRRMNIDQSKLNWVVLDRATTRPLEIEAVGGFGIDRENLSEVYFDLNETVILSPERLDKLIQKAQKVSGKFYIVGYADESGIEAKNYLLSQERAAAVAAYLAARNVHSSRINNYGAGVSHLYQGLDKNRRASVSFLIENFSK